MGQMCTGQPFTFLGVTRVFPMVPNNWQLSIALTAEEIRKWPSQIHDFLKDGRLLSLICKST